MAEIGQKGQRLVRELLINNKLGMHARPAAMFVKLANRYPCEVWVEKDGEEVNGKSIMGLMMLAAGCGSKIRVSAMGERSDEALGEIQSLVDRKFDED
ncbi:MAG TPA: HPr family phosphocarrier protein [Verrucomicrobiae bacterium]|nr:HPr family phosphocarrier protein [Verrucomicrobiae bacterium]